MRNRRAGQLSYDPISKEWRNESGTTPPHFKARDIEARARSEGYWMGFLAGTQISAVVGMAVGLMIHFI